MPSFARYLTKVGDSLKEMKIELGLSGRNTNDMPSPSDIDKARVMLKSVLKSFVSDKVLSHSSGLENLHLDMIYFYDIENDRPFSLISLEELVKAIPNKSLKRLNILVWTDMSSEGVEEGHKWRNGDVLLANQFPSLVQVVVTVTVVQDMNFNEYYSGTMDDLGMDELDESVIEGRVEKLFPRCREKGILKFVHKPWY
ncbi:hypothetical protein Moror_2047 [Moniliophthora roreri MCA 2997]|uniref:Uncharacterized protein n=2 Tax=Moniliophthora roreri TaxID=221103 RepID=V2Y755_MONRO|nr:hypothetical protein Moror_2047 [Moniliophthora roreri MCA 2997]